MILTSLALLYTYEHAFAKEKARKRPCCLTHNGSHESAAALIQTNKEWLDQIDTEVMRYYSSIEKDVSVSVDNDTAKIIGKNLVDARINGYRNTWRLQLEMDSLKRNGIWKITHATASVY